MTVNAQDIKRIVLDEVGDWPDRYLEDRLDAAWDSYSDKAYTEPRLQELYTKRRLIDLALGRVRNQVDTSVTADEGAKLAQLTANLRAMRLETQAEIAAIENGTGLPRGGLLTATVPIPPPDPNMVDANAILYSGSPYLPGPARPS
jgi:hypothetical protein